MAKRSLAIPAKEMQFRIVSDPQGSGIWHISWISPVPVLQWAIGPRPTRTSRRKSRFDAFLPYSALELEQFGNDVMHYALGAMGDDENEVDLPGPEWGWNLEMLLNSVDTTRLNRSQVVRLTKLLNWLRGEPWSK